MAALTARKVGTYETGTPEWHAARAGKMSGSRIAAAAGISPWTSQYTLFWQMTGLVIEDVSPQMAWGNILEPVIIEEFALRHPEIRVIRKPGTWLNTSRSWQLANPDALLITPGVGARRRPDTVLEIKTSGYSDGWGKQGTDEIPVHYLAQVLWYLDTLGLRFCVVVVLIGGSDYREYLVEADPTAATELRIIGRQFLDLLEAETPPDLDGSDSTYETVQKLHPEIDGSTIDIDDKLALKIARARARLVVPTQELNEAKSELALAMGLSKTAYWHGMKAADRRSKMGGNPYLQLTNNLTASTVVPTIERKKAAG